MWYMDTTIRNLDAKLYRRLRVRATAESRTVGELLNEAMRAYLARPAVASHSKSILDLPTFDFGPGSERLSEQVDEIVYRQRR